MTLESISDWRGFDLAHLATLLTPEDRSGVREATELLLELALGAGWRSERRMRGGALTDLRAGLEGASRSDSPVQRYAAAGAWGAWAWAFYGSCDLFPEEGRAVAGCFWVLETDDSAGYEIRLDSRLGCVRHHAREAVEAIFDMMVPRWDRAYWPLGPVTGESGQLYVWNLRHSDDPEATAKYVHALASSNGLCVVRMPPPYEREALLPCIVHAATAVEALALELRRGSAPSNQDQAHNQLDSAQRSDLDMSNPFSMLENATIRIQRSDGTLIGPLKCTLNKGRARIYEKNLSVAAGDRVIRTLPNGEEVLLVTDVDYSDGHPSGLIPPSWLLTLIKSGNVSSAVNTPAVQAPQGPAIGALQVPNGTGADDVNPARGERPDRPDSKS